MNLCPPWGVKWPWSPLLSVALLQRGGRAVRGRGGLHAAMTVPEVWTMRILLVCGLGTVAGLLLTSADRRAGGAHSGGERKAQEAERIFRAFDRRTK